MESSAPIVEDVQTVANQNFHLDPASVRMVKVTLYSTNGQVVQFGSEQTLVKI